jgi:inner membrane protein
MIAGAVTGACLVTSAICEGGYGVMPLISGFAGATIGGLFPDIDSSTSKLGSKFKIVSKIINNMFGHRGLFHCPLLIVGFFFLFRHLFATWGIQEYAIGYIGFLLGMCMHLVCDMTTRGGIPVLYPFYTTKFSITPMKSGSKWEPLMLGIVIIIAIVSFASLTASSTYLGTMPWLFPA